MGSWPSRRTSPLSCSCCLVLFALWASALSIRRTNDQPSSYAFYRVLTLTNRRTLLWTNRYSACSTSLPIFLKLVKASGMLWQSIASTPKFDDCIVPHLFCFSFPILKFITICFRVPRPATELSRWPRSVRNVLLIGEHVSISEVLFYVSNIQS